MCCSTLLCALFIAPLVIGIIIISKHYTLSFTRTMSSMSRFNDPDRGSAADSTTDVSQIVIAKQLQLVRNF